jgi:hypothetical protein
MRLTRRLLALACSALVGCAATVADLGASASTVLPDGFSVYGEQSDNTYNSLNPALGSIDDNTYTVGVQFDWDMPWRRQSFGQLVPWDEFAADSLRNSNAQEADLALIRDQQQAQTALLREQASTLNSVVAQLETLNTSVAPVAEATSQLVSSEVWGWVTGVGGAGGGIFAVWYFILRKRQPNKEPKEQ